MTDPNQKNIILSLTFFNRDNSDILKVFSLEKLIYKYF